MSYTLEDYLEDMAEFEPQQIDEVLEEYYCPSCLALIKEECCCDEDEE